MVLLTLNVKKTKTAADKNGDFNGKCEQMLLEPRTYF